MQISPRDRFYEISKHELEIMPRDLLFISYMKFRYMFPDNSVTGDNIVIMYASDYYALIKNKNAKPSDSSSSE